MEFDDPCGWYVVPLHEGTRDFLKTNLVQIGVVQNQHSGRDTHIRQIKVFGPRDTPKISEMQPVFKTVEMTQYLNIR